MQADEFEKKIQDKMEGFELAPSGEVWKHVATRIEKENKKRRVLIYWLLTGFVLLSATIGYWYINNDNHKSLVTNNFDNKIDNSTKRENYKIPRDTAVIPAFSFKVQKVDAAKSAVFLKKELTKQVAFSAAKNNAFTNVTNSKVMINAFKEKPEKGNENIRFSKKETTSSLPPHRFYNPSLIPDTALTNNLIKGRENTDKATATKAEGRSDKKDQINKKWKFGFSVFSGISDHHFTSSPNVSNTAQENYSDPGTNLSSGNFDYSAIQSKNFQTAFSIGFGFFFQRPITKRLGLSAGINYHLYTIKSVVGNKVVQQRSFYDSIFLNTADVNTYYAISGNGHYSNRYHVAEIPVNLELKLNKKEKQPLLFYAGITPGYLISSNALYANLPARVYYVDKQKFHRFQLSAQTGFSFPIVAFQKYQLQAGPVFQYAFTTAATTVKRADPHLIFIGIKANIDLR